MKSTPVGRYGTKLTRWGSINCYLVREEDGFTLIDAGLKGSEKNILAAATALGSSIRRILLTHAHLDHMGSVDALAATIPDLIVGASERSLSLLRIPPDRSLRPGEPAGKGIRGATPGITTPVPLTLQEGDLIGSLRVIETLGHIPGHLAFLDERDGTLYAGDELFGLDHLGITGWSPWWFPLNRWWDRALAKQSAQKLLGYQIDRFATGHGRVREGGRPALEQAIRLAKS